MNKTIRRKYMVYCWKVDNFYTHSAEKAESWKGVCERNSDYMGTKVTEYARSLPIRVKGSRRQKTWTPACFESNCNISNRYCLGFENGVSKACVKCPHRNIFKYS
jgi:hypothetical protein